jgi:putative PIN family toxin of toxin-antitoxin system
VKVVVDTNILWVAISRRSKTHWVFSELIKGTFVLCVTTDILEEYEEIISRRLGSETSKSIMELLDNLPNVEFITKYYRWELIEQDYDDNKFVDCAIACNANYLATNDQHFNILKSIAFPKVNVINVDEFKSVFEKTRR